MALRTRGRPEQRALEARECIDRIEDFKERSGYDRHCSRMKLWDKQWRGVMERYNAPWSHASTYNPPLTFSKTEDVHAVLFGYFSSLDFFSLAASGGMAVGSEIMRERGQLWTDYMRWSMQNESNTIPCLDKFSHDGCLYGHAFMYIPYLRLTRQITAEIPIPDELSQAKKITDRQLVAAALGPTLLSGPHGNGGDVYEITFVDDDGEEKDGLAWVDRNNPQRPEGEPVLIVQREVVYYDAPRPRTISPWNMLVPPSAKDLQSARWFAHREWMTYGEIAGMVRSGVFNMATKQDLTKLRDKAKNTGEQVSEGNIGESDSVDEQRDDQLGLTYLEDRKQMYEVYFEYYLEDLVPEGTTESMVRAVTTSTGAQPMLLMRHPLEYLYPHGRRPFTDWCLFKVDGRYYGMGIPEILESTQVETNAFYQSRSDVIELTTKPCGFYDPASGLQPDIIRVTPGQLIKSRNPQHAFAPLSFPVDPGQLLREQNLAEGQAEKAVGSTDLGLGRSSNRPNAPRTLGGTAIMVRQQQLRTEVYLKRAMYGCGDAGGGVAEFLQQYKDLLAAFTPANKEFRALGTDEIRKIQRSDLAGRFDFVIDLGAEVNNPQLRMQNAVLRYQYSMSNPLVMNDPQVLWRLTIDLWEATGMRNASRVLRPPSPLQSHPPYSQEEEIAILAKGLYVDPLPTDDHQDHLGKIWMLLQNTQLLASRFSAREIPLLNQHTQKHMEYIQQASQMMAGMQQPGGAPAGPAPPGGGQRGPLSQASMAGPAPMREPMMGPIQSEVETGLTP